jgi:hypothetical protein
MENQINKKTAQSPNCTQAVILRTRKLSKEVLCREKKLKNKEALDVYAIRLGFF